MSGNGFVDDKAGIQELLSEYGHIYKRKRNGMIITRAVIVAALSAFVLWLEIIESGASRVIDHTKIQPWAVMVSYKIIPYVACAFIIAIIIIISHSCNDISYIMSPDEIKQFLRDIEEDDYVAAFEKCPQRFDVSKTIITEYVDGNDSGNDSIGILSFTHEGGCGIADSVYGNTWHRTTDRLMYGIQTEDEHGKFMTIPTKVELPYMRASFFPKTYGDNLSVLLPCGDDGNRVAKAFIDTYRKVMRDIVAETVMDAVLDRAVIYMSSFPKGIACVRYFRRNADISDGMREEIQRLDEFMQPFFEKQKKRNMEYIRRQATWAKEQTYRN